MGNGLCCSLTYDNVLKIPNLFWLLRCTNGAQRAKIPENVHKPSLGGQCHHFELNGFLAPIWVPWSLSESKKAIIQ